MVKELIERTFPGVTDFHTVHDPVVRPVEYSEGTQIKREYPPIARWKFQGRRYSFLFEPQFVERPVRGWFWSGTRVDVSYEESQAKLIRCLQRLVNGLPPNGL